MKKRESLYIWPFNKKAFSLAIIARKSLTLFSI
jgi:hypothetical protein